VLLADFRQWCVDAEATGIQALKDFVAELRCYTCPRWPSRRSRKA